MVDHVDPGLIGSVTLAPLMGKVRLVKTVRLNLADRGLQRLAEIHNSFGFMKSPAEVGGLRYALVYLCIRANLAKSPRYQESLHVLNELDGNSPSSK